MIPRTAALLRVHRSNIWGIYASAPLIFRGNGHHHSEVRVMSIRFQSRVVLSGYVSCKSDAKQHGQTESRRNSPDLYVLKDLTGMPYISGSNFKNFLRRQVESLIKETLGPGFSCDSFNRDKACLRLGESRADEGVYLKDLLARCGGNEERLLSEIEKHTCITCKLFGSQIVESQITADDLKPSIWSAQVKLRKKNDLLEQEISESTVPEKFMIRVVLNNCEAWQRGLFIMGLSRAQNKLITLSTGRKSEQYIAAIDDLSVRSLESARDLYSRLANLEATDGEEVTTEQLQFWISSLRDFLKKAASFALAS
ncbi:MAG: hypothetical protein K2X27_13080 [Candidatus Obscuribacterales bacterium]|nr:hypothetical protein [Candidatus Obscuribacterales bacterium]